MNRGKRKIGLILALAVLILLLSVIFTPFLLGIAGEYMLKRGVYSTAINIANTAIQIKPDYAYPYSVRADAYKHMGDLERALQDYGRAISLNPDEWVFYTKRGNIFRSLGKSEDAISDYSNSIINNPSNTDTYINRGRVYALIGKYSEAIDDFTLAITLDPESADAYLSRGIVLSLSNKVKALKDFEEAERLFELKGDVNKVNQVRKLIDDLNQS